MRTENELKIDNLSYTKKDFYQVYPEALDLVNKLTDIWHPESSNESDPGNVLLKLLSAYTDKLNYTIDKKLLERFPSSVTEDAAMRKLCEMLVYDMHYYRSATTTASFMWVGDELNSVDGTNNDSSKANNYITLPAFQTVLTNDSEDIQYILVEPVTLKTRYEIEANKKIVEGTLVELEINDDNILRSYNLDAKNRFYLPETGIAENGIYITDASDATVSWERVQNLNTIRVNKKAWKFGLESITNNPYIQFPDNILELIGNGLKVYYIRSSGASGNINAQTLTKLLDPTVTLYSKDPEDPTQDITSEIEVSDQLVIQNPYSTINGADKETIDEAWENYKKTIGTFETLVTCRDYMNAIYNLVVDEHTDNTPLVSNCLVADIRSDINLANTVVSYDNYGIRYDVEPMVRNQSTITTAKVASAQGIVTDNPVTVLTPEGTPVSVSLQSILSALSESQVELQVEVNSDSNDYFNLILYPLTSIKTAYSKDTYQKSFKPDLSARGKIDPQIDDYKTIAHKLKTPFNEDIYLIKNYYKLSARISTTSKVNRYEANQIKNNVYTALYKNFNARNLDYGEEIPYDSILDVMLNADERIKDINLNEPEIITKYMLTSGEEGLLTNNDELLTNLSEEQKAKSKEIYQKLIAKNVLAGRTPLFNYNKNLVSFYGQTNYNDEYNPYNLSEEELEEFSKVFGSEDNNYSSTTTNNENSITTVDTNLIIYPQNITDTYTLRENEKFQLIAPKLVTKMTYPTYINYFFKKADATDAESDQAVPCCLIHIDKHLMEQINTYQQDPSYIDLTNFDTDLAARKNAFDKTFTWLLSKAKQVFRKGKQASHTPGYLVDKECYEYSSILSRKGTLYKSITSYDPQYDYYTTTDLVNGIEDSKEASFELIKTDPRDSKVLQRFTVTKTEFLSKLNSCALRQGEVRPTIESIENSYTNTYTGIAGNLGASCTINGEPVNNIIGWEVRSYTDTSDDGQEVERRENIPVYAAYNFKVLPVTLGLDAGVANAYIKKGIDYALRQNDELYINYTDNNDTTICRKYYRDAQGNPKVLTYKNGVEIKDYSTDDEAFNGIIKPNFDLYDSVKWSLLGHSFDKSRAKIEQALPISCTEWDNVLGMFSLTSSDEIEIRDFSKNVITKSCYLYWLTNNNNTLTFVKECVDPNNADYGLYSCVLEDSEALFYTDPSKSSLTTFGAGTKLTLRYSISEIEKSPWLLIWSLNNNDSVTKDDIALNGLGAFANNDWITQPNGIIFSTDNSFTIQQMIINTAVQDDVVSNINLSSDETPFGHEYIDSSKWWKLKSDEINILRINNEAITYLNVSPEDSNRYRYYWSLKPVLDLNIGPDLTQKLSDYNNPDTNLVISKNKIDLYTSYFKNEEGKIIPNDEIKNELEYNYTYIKEEINYEPLNKTPLRQISLRSNYLIQKTGGFKINLSVTDLNGIRTDNLIVYPFAELPITSSKEGGSDSVLAEGTTMIDFSNMDQVDLPVYVPSQHMLVCAYYYHTDYNDLTHLIKVTSYKSNTETTEDYLIDYKNSLTKNSQIVLQPGLNIIACTNSCTLKFNNANSGDTLDLLHNDFVKIKDNAYGVDLKMLDLKASEVEDFLKNYIRPYPTFYYNIPIKNERYLDVKTLDDPYSWFNKKNICNNFVISEIDVSSLSDIDINKNSKVN